MTLAPRARTIPKFYRPRTREALLESRSSGVCRLHMLGWGPMALLTASLRHPLFLEFDERLQRFRGGVRHSPDNQAIGFPTAQVESVLLKNRVCQMTRLVLGPNEQVDIVLLVLKDHGGHFFGTQVIKPAANQFVTLIAEIKDRRRKVEFSGKPWFHGMLIGGGNVKEVIPYQ